MTSSESEFKEDIIVEKNNRSGLITLNRPNVLNALSYEMISAFRKFYLDCLKDPHIYGIVIESKSDRAFCAGGDMRYISDTINTNIEVAYNYFCLEYDNNWVIEQFNKPTVPLINGIVMGGGVGISVYGTHCVMSENTSFAMPEVSIGFFPDIGSSYFMSKLPGEMGMYLALTGATISASDCYYLGIASHNISAHKFDEIKKAMFEAEPIDPILNSLHEDFGESELQYLQSAIDRVFSGNSLEEIMSNLEGEANDGHSEFSDWARDQEDLIRQKCPLSLKVAFRKINEAKGYSSLKDALIRDISLVRHWLENPNLQEGVRAVLVDKLNDPQWKPSLLEEVTDSMVSSLFIPIGNTPEFTDISL